MKLSVFYQDQETYPKEFLKALLRRLIQRTCLVGLVSLAFPCFSYRGGSTFTAGSPLAAGLISLTVAFFVLPLTLKGYKSQVEASVGEEDKVLVRFYEDYLEVHQG